VALDSSIPADLRPRRNLLRLKNDPPDVVAFAEAIVEFFVEAADLLGVPKSLGAIYGLCFASPEPLGFSEIHDRLALSAGTISQGLRVLREVGALKSAGCSAQRRERYEPDLELRKLVAHYLEGRLQKQLESGRGRLQAIVRAIPIGKNETTKILRERMKALQNWHNKTRALMPIVKIFLKVP
jgi:DNA-binding transcriptional regulator GbsR (MarR family)